MRRRRRTLAVRPSYEAVQWHHSHSIPSRRATALAARGRPTARHTGGGYARAAAATTLNLTIVELSIGDDDANGNDEMKT